MTSETRKQLSQLNKSLLEFSPLVVFFITYKMKGLLWATGALLIATLLAVTIQFALTRKISKMQLITTGMVVVFGGLTLYLQDPFYFKIKVSIINVLLGAALAIGLLMRKLFLKDMLGSTVDMPDAAWRTLSWRWVGFFLALAVLNVVVWQGFSEDAWVNFKAYGLLGLTMAFAMANAPFMARHIVEKPANPSADG